MSGIAPIPKTLAEDDPLHALEAAHRVPWGAIAAGVLVLVLAIAGIVLWAGGADEQPAATDGAAGTLQEPTEQR